MLGLGSVAVVLVRSAVLVVGSIAASRQLHHKLLVKMLRLPMSFYDAQPTGERARHTQTHMERTGLQEETCSLCAARSVQALLVMFCAHLQKVAGQLAPPFGLHATAAQVQAHRHPAHCSPSTDSAS